MKPLPLTAVQGVGPQLLSGSPIVSYMEVVLVGISVPLMFDVSINLSISLYLSLMLVYDLGHLNRALRLGIV